MDWNKSNTVLIIAFIIVNIFLLFVTYDHAFCDISTENIDKKFAEDVKKILEQKNISVNCELPKEIYIVPFLETMYEVIKPNQKLIATFLGNEVEADENIYSYVNSKQEHLDIIDNKKIIYTARESLGIGKTDESEIDIVLNKFINEKQINIEGYEETFRYKENQSIVIVYAQMHNGLSIDNSYMHFFIDKQGVYKFEAQKIKSIVENKAKIRVISILEALPRLVSYSDINNKDIVDIKMTYFSTESENWKDITKINADPTWKIIFSDGTIKHLNAYD